VVRSFALHQAHGHADYDLCDSTHCQLLHWGGSSGTDGNAAHAATLATAGETLWFHGQRAEAWFHQNCGGRTASPGEVWPATRVDHARPCRGLVSRADPYCTAAARGSGRRVCLWGFDGGAGNGRAGSAGMEEPDGGAARVNRDGRLRCDWIRQEISCGRFSPCSGARASGWGKILSNWFEVSRQGDQFVFHGRGSGHGVGLCQAGAAAMSAQGRDAAQILAQYFPGAVAGRRGYWIDVAKAGGQGIHGLRRRMPADARIWLPRSEPGAWPRRRFGLGCRPWETITVRAFRSTPAFRDATLAPGWVAAFTEGEWIATQPLPRWLRARCWVR
jgi:stage II sporulation protein D